MKRKKGFYGTATIINDNDSRQATDMECTACDEPIQTRGGAAFDTPVSIRISSYRCRLADVDGLSAKAVLDALVLARVIANDTTKEVTEVLFSQTKVKDKSEEKVIVTVERVNNE